MKKHVNATLIKYHQKFDDTIFDKIREDLENMLHDRSDFFEAEVNEAETNELNLEYIKKMREYWSGLDEAIASNNESNKIINILRNNVEGLSPCGCCNRTSALKTKLTNNASGNKYLVRMCESCYGKGTHEGVYRKTKVVPGMSVPDDLTAKEKKEIGGLK